MKVPIALVLGAILVLAGCSSTQYRTSVDSNAYSIIEQKQFEALGKTNSFTVETAADQLRRRLLIEQGLQFSTEASLGTQYLDPIPHWPDDDYLDTAGHLLSINPFVQTTNGPIVLSLVDALRIAALNSRNYQSAKENVFRAAMSLDLERDQFGLTWAGALSGGYFQDRADLQNAGGVVAEGFDASAGLDVTKRLANGAQLSFGIGWNLLKILLPNSSPTVDSVFGDASISVPLLRGAGKHIAMESLTQAERDMIYTIYEFEDFKRDFAVGIASSYYSVLEQQNNITNATDNYESLVRSTRRARRLLQAGDLPAIQVNQAIQDELNARNNWIGTRESYAASLDSFKIQLGLPADAAIELDSTEFEKIREQARGLYEGALDQMEIEAQAATDLNAEVPDFDAEVVLVEPSNEDAGRFELDPEYAIQLAFENRLDLRIAKEEIYDAQRAVVIAADNLRAELTLFGSASFRGNDFSEFDLNTGSYDALLNIDLPLERTAEAIAYRSSYLSLESAIRNLQELEDSIKIDILNQLRGLRETRESLKIQAISVNLSESQVENAQLNLQAGRIEIRDLLDAEEALLDARNSLTAAAVNYRISELELQRDLGLLEVDSDGLWIEFDPEQYNDETIN